ncbi:unnamed protein product, partial [Allacma fusca]
NLRIINTVLQNQNMSGKNIYRGYYLKNEERFDSKTPIGNCLQVKNVVNTNLACRQVRSRLKG